MEGTDGADARAGALGASPGEGDSTGARRLSAATASLPESWTEGTPFTFIVACGRSGTTLLRAILDSHPDMAVPPETRFIVSLLRRRRRHEPARGFRTDPFVADLEWNFGLRELELSRDEARRALEPAPADTPDAIPGDLLEALGSELVPRPSARVRVRARAGAAGADLRRAAEVVALAVFIPIRRRFRRPRTLAAERR